MTKSLIDQPALLKAMKAYAAASEDSMVNLGGMQDAIVAYLKAATCGSSCAPTQNDNVVGNQQPEDCRAAFEAWSEEQGWEVEGYPDARQRWTVWQAAWKAKPEQQAPASVDALLVAEEHNADEWKAPTLETIGRYKQHQAITRRDWIGVLGMLAHYMTTERESLALRPMKDAPRDGQVILAFYTDYSGVLPIRWGIFDSDSNKETWFYADWSDEACGDEHYAGWLPTPQFPAWSIEKRWRGSE